MPASLLNKLNRQTLLEMAGKRSFERGENYFDEERVHALVEFEGQLAATVEGSLDYRVKLWEAEGRLGFSCACPFAEDGNFCKHAVAVGLASIVAREAKARGGEEWRTIEIADLNDARVFLERQDKNALVELILREALDSESACERLLEAARTTPPRTPE
jgi:uncharacterized Zn finger protein